MLDRSNTTADTNETAVERIAARMVEIERVQGFCLKRDLLAEGFAEADLAEHAEAAKRIAAETKARSVRVIDTYATDEDARRILGMRLGDLLGAAHNPDPDKRRDFARRARSTARTLETGAVYDTRPHPYAARLLVELAARAEQA
jgi:hypothetical protein